MTFPRAVRFLLKGIAALIALGIASVAILLALMWHEHGATLDLPAPTGPFAVGRTIYDWVNGAQTDELAPSQAAPSKTAKREVLAWIWYPAASPSNTPADYLPAWWRDAEARSTQSSTMSVPVVLMNRFFTRDPAVVHVHSTSDPAISPAQSSYPVVLFRAGLGALTTDYTTLVEDLASHGYVVAGFDAPYRTGVVVFPDGRVITRPPELNPEDLSGEDEERFVEKILPLWVTDAQFVVDQLSRLNASDPQGRFTARLDLNRLGMFGHSFGGAQSLQFCHDDARCKAAIDIDGMPFGSVVKEGTRQPAMFLIEHMSIQPGGSAEVVERLHSLYNRLPDSRAYWSIRGANHWSFADQILVKTRYVVGPLLFFTGGLYQRRGLAITTAAVHAFFDVHLKNQRPSLLEELRKTYPEIESPFTR